MIPVWVLILSVLFALIIGSILGFVFRVLRVEGGFGKAKEQAEKIVNDANELAEKNKKDKIVETKQEIYRLMSDCDKDIKERKNQAKQLEDKLNARETSLDNRSANLDKRELNLDRKEQSLDDKKALLEEKNNKLDEIIENQSKKLIEIAQFTREEAHDVIMKQVEEDMAQETALYIREEEEKAKDEAQKKSKEIISLAIQKYAQDVTAESTVSVVALPNEDMKGRLIGREGRNIRTIESLTGVDLIIDDTPEAVVLSGFDPIRREIAKRSLEALIADGRIHPARIEELVEKARAEVNQFIREAGDKAIFDVGVGRMHPDLIKILGRLHFRTSYGQNVLQHSIETAFLAGKMAAELGENEVLAKRAGLLHDIGKAIDHEMEGSHVELGVMLAQKYKENPVVINSIESHHGDAEPKSVIAVLVAAADALSASRPGARSESVENYITRLENLETIAKNMNGVDTAYAVQAGREIRVMVKPNEVDDAQVALMARNIKKQIEDQLSYPGTIKVTVIREKRVQEIAK